MSVDKTPTGVVYTVTNGTAGQQYPLTFPYIKGADVKAYYVANGKQTVLTYGIQYTVEDQALTTLVALPVGAKLAIYRQTDLTQEIVWKDGQAVYTPDIMKADDKLTLIAQEIAADMSRTVKLTREEEAAGIGPEDVLQSVYASRDAAAASASAASDSKTAAAQAAEHSAEFADSAAQKAVDAEYWAKRAEGASNNCPATPDHLGSVRPRKALSVDADGSIDVNVGPGLKIDAATNQVKPDLSAVDTGVLPITHGGTGANSPAGALDNLGLTSWKAAIETSNSQRLRNVVLSGRHKDGYPAYLVGQEFLDMQHEDGVYNTRRGTVSASGEYNASYRATKPLRNQVVFQSEGWLTPAGVPSGYWQYDFADGPHILTGLFMKERPGADLTYFPKQWSLLGWNKTTSSWDVIYSRAADQGLSNNANNLKAYGRMHWFTNNTKAYQRVRIKIDSNSGGSYTAIGTLRFYEAVYPGMHKYDVALYATDKHPFLASIACGLNETGTRTLDHPVKLTTPVVFDGSKFAECSRNYMYLVPETSVGALPENLDSSKAVTIPGQGAFLYTDTRKIHYGSVRDIEMECFGLLQSRYTVAGVLQPEANMGATQYVVRNSGNVTTDITEKYRGAPSSYYMSGSATGWMSPNLDLKTSFPDKNGHPYANEMTVEVDFKWTGPAPSTSDSYAILYDNGWYTNAGINVRYHWRSKGFVIALSSAVCDGATYAVPFDAADGAWHTLSLSLRKNNMFVHIDGKCLGRFENVPLSRPNYRYWMLGRYIHTNGYQWYGHINNFRLTLGTALYQGADYTVPSTFYKAWIPDKTLWYDAAAGVVKEWQAATQTWLGTPMLPIGHVDTSWKEHLLTDQPCGTFHLKQTKYVDPNGYATDGQYDGNHTPACLFNFGHGGEYPYSSLNAANAAHYVSFTLESAMAFERLLLCMTTWDWRAFPAIFKLSGSNDSGGTWTSLVDRTTFVNDGGQPMAMAKSNGNSSDLTFYKTFDISDEAAFKQFKLDFPIKSDVPYYGDYGYTATRIMLTIRGAKPEVINVSSYVVGDTFSYGPIFATVNNEIEVPLPFANVAFDVGGYVEEEQDYSLKRRVLGQLGYNYADGNVVSGELLYKTSESVLIQTAASNLSIYTGANWNSKSVSAASTSANIYIVAKKRY